MINKNTPSRIVCNILRSGRVFLCITIITAVAAATITTAALATFSVAVQTGYGL